MFLERPTADVLIHAAAGLKKTGDEVILIMLGEKSNIAVPKMIAGLNQQEIVFFGGIFPAVVHADGKYEEGAVVKALPSLAKPVLFRDLSSARKQLGGLKIIREALDQQYTALVLVDGLTADISLFLQELFSTFGNSVHYLGGGAGSLSLIQRPCLFTSEGVFQNAAITAFVRLRSNLGVRHGWERCTGPFVATKTSHNIIMELNWEKAFDVYQRAVETASGRKLTRETFFSVAKAYPFGMLKEGAEDIVRDPILVNDRGELVCVGEIPENAVLNILRGDDAKLLDAAGRTAKDCLFQIEGKEVHAALLFDCTSRALFLKDFPAELRVIQSGLSSVLPRKTLAGALTLGEISSYGLKYLEFLNKTAVLGVLYQ
jgi:hypothetical protein